MDVRRWTFAVAPVAAAAGLGGLGARGAPRTYARLRKPSWAPPAAAFGPVWSALYVGIGAAGWRLYASGSRSTRTLHLGQLALNAAWPSAFFGIRDKQASLAITALLVPYLGWSGFATALNATVSDPGEGRRRAAT